MDRLPDLVQRVGHSQPGRVEWTALVIVENPANRGTVVQDHVARRIIPVGDGSALTRASVTTDSGTGGGGGSTGVESRRWVRTDCSIPLKPRTFFRI